MSVFVMKPGLLSSLQDGGRLGYAALGVGRAGAADWPAWRLANALVGNANGEAALEFTLIGPTLRFERATVIALTGAPVDARVGNQSLPGWTRCVLPAGSALQLGGMRHGCRGYLAVRGGFAAATVLGSRSTDLNARIGPFDGRALQIGDQLEVGDGDPALPPRSVRALQMMRWGLDPQPWFDYGRAPLALWRGHHFDQLDDTSQQALFKASFTLSKDSNRVASRLDGQRLNLRQPMELISEATVPGTLQLPPSGQPILLQAEAPVTGGYPRIGQLAAVDLPRLAQRRPGDTLCFRETTLSEAAQRLAARRLRLQRLLEHIERRLDFA
ncbi:biotin-dependent carboxyltransferase family protein [Dyella humicola]|uniref:5-oxoprolinase subunit C family protein n=1 Tax=Dyella humicola TaxID=2992126 RepID=UPI00225407BE|nr:biotin-dependent carboxyltransferase family protein [Dyella humicola]